MGARPDSDATPAPNLAPVLAPTPRVMGVINLTPDSFSDGGRLGDLEAARAHARALVDAGADILDVGGESTRPGAAPVSVAEECDRVVRVIEALARDHDTPISIDTMKPEVAEAAFGVGASIWNDVMALRAPGALETAARLNASVIVMHMQGAPQTMQRAPHYDDVVEEVGAFLAARVAAALAAGVPAAGLMADPGIGFGKTLAHNMALMAGLERVAERAGAPLAFGASRKRFVADIDPSAAHAHDRLGGSLAAAARAAQAGAVLVRVHDVRETVQFFRVWAAIAAASAASGDHE